MRILYSAFECNPYIGSDAYVGWSWAVQMSKEHEVHVLTNAKNCKDIEKYKQDHYVGAQFHYVEVPKFLSKVLKGRKFYFASYVLWQRKAYKAAKKLKTEVDFDIVHHVSIADFRVIGKLWKLNKPYVFGPVGGAQETPHQLEYYIRNYKKNEKIRSIINKISLSMPSYKKAISRTAQILVSNDETREMLKKYFGDDIKMIQLCELGIDSNYLIQRETIVHKRTDMVHVLVSGRLMYRKGIELLLDAVQMISTDIPYVVDIYGGGHQVEAVKQQIFDRNLQNKVILHGKIPYESMPDVYEKSDFFVLPSLRETTGTAVIEAMANKLPVVALKQNGVKYLVESDAGILVDIENRDETVRGLTNAIVSLIENHELCLELGNRAFEKLKERYTWEAKKLEMEKIYLSITSSYQQL